MLGQVILKLDYTKVIDLRQLENGLYFLKIVNKQMSTNFQFIKTD